MRLAFSRLSSRLLPSPGAPSGRLLGWFPRDRWVIPPGRGRRVAPELAAHRRARGACGRCWSPSVRSGRSSPPAGPGVRGSPLPRFLVRRRPLAGRRRAQLLGDALWALGSGTKSLPPGVATPLSRRFPPPGRGAVAARWEGGGALSSEGGRSPQTPAPLCRLQRLSLCRPWQVGSLDSRAGETGQMSAEGKDAHPGRPIRGASSTRGLSPPPTNMRASSSPLSLAGARRPGGVGSWPVAPRVCGRAWLGKAAAPRPNLASYQVASGFGPLPFTLGGQRPSSSTPPPNT